jgi:hypothetical protein
MGEVLEPLPDAWLLGYQNSERLRLIVVTAEQQDLTWTATSPLRIQRISGVFLDDARLSGGQWNHLVSTEKVNPTEMPSNFV